MAEPLGELRLLVIDDNKQMRTIIGTVLAAAGVRHISYAQDGLEGLAILKRTPVDVIFCDHEMPVLNGLDFITCVRTKTGNDRFSPIIMLTGHSDRRHLEDARDRGVTEFLSKPVTAVNILKRLEAIILRPRPYVVADTYFGPDRRRRLSREYFGPLRRSTDPRPVAALEL